MRHWAATGISRVGTPTEQKVRLTIRLEAQALAHAIECRFVRTGKTELPKGR